MAAMEIEPIRVGVIQVGERHRALSDDAVTRLAASMAEIGLRQPITIRVADMMIVDGQEVECVPVLVAGRHRLAAAISLGWSHIDCLEVDDDALRAELWEIDENLMRAELSPSQQAEHLARRKEVWEALEVSGKISPKGGRPEGFASQTAKASGVDKKTVTTAIRRASAIGPDIKLVAGTSLDSGVELDALARMSEAERRPLIARAAAGEAVTARAPINDYDVIEKQVDAVMAAWNRACPEARDRVRELIDAPVFDNTRSARA
jgi:ParB-like chromosome segregation protein Spo0J